MKKSLFTRKLIHLSLGFAFSFFNLFAFQNCKQEYQSVELQSSANSGALNPAVPVYANITMSSAQTLFKTSAVSFCEMIDIGLAVFN